MGEGVTSRGVTSDARKIRNASDDGAFGMTVGAWCEGIASVTGTPCTTPLHGPMRQLIECQSKHRPAGEDPVEWSRKSAAEFARAFAGRALTTFGYVAWIDSDKQSGTVLKARSAPGAIDYEAIRRDGERKRDEARKRPPSKPPEPLKPERMRADMARLFGGRKS